jgi:hypothetical protein
VQRAFGTRNRIPLLYHIQSGNRHAELQPGVLFSVQISEPSIIDDQQRDQHILRAQDGFLT